jgi:hypothetical protein
MNPSDQLSYVPTNSDAWWSLAEFGTYATDFPGVDDPASPSERDRMRTWIRNVRQSGSDNAIFVDTTMVHTVDRLLRDASSAPTPTTLLDLANAVSSVILADTIFHLDNPYVDSIALNELLGVDPVFITVPTRQADPCVGAHLRGLWLHCGEYVEKIGAAAPGLAQDGDQVKSAWEALIGSPIDWSEWGRAAVEFRNRAYGEVSVAREIYDIAAKLFAFDQTIRIPNHAADRKIDDFILECNIRSIFNYAVAYMLGLDYVPNTFRLPFQRFLRENGLARGQGLIRFLDANFRKAIAEVYGIAGELRLPFFLSAILAKASSLADFREVLADYRLKAARLRARRKELNEAVANRDIGTSQRILKALEREDVPACWKWAASTVAVTAVAAGAAAVESAHPGVLHALEIAAHIVVPGAIVFGAESINTLFKPRMRLIARAAAAANSLGDGRSKIAALWNLRRPLDQAYVGWLNRAAAIGY